MNQRRFLYLNDRFIFVLIISHKSPGIAAQSLLLWWWAGPHILAHREVSPDLGVGRMCHVQHHTGHHGDGDHLDDDCCQLDGDGGQLDGGADHLGVGGKGT